MPEAGTVEPRDRGRATVAALSGFAMLAVLVAVALVGSLLHGDPTGADSADPSDGPSASAEPVPSASPAPAPSTGAAKPWRLFRVGDRVTTTTSFTDPGTNDTHTCDIAWDDGTTTSGPAPDHVCRGTHTYAHAGMYTITSVITDDDGGVLNVPGVLVIVYDPAAGAARGTGRLSSGAFDFTARYPAPSTTEPGGSVTVALPSRLNLDLRNHQHLDWLVVTVDGKLAIKGTAERSPGHRVGFLLYGYVGCPAGQAGGCQPGPHRLRTVVWDTAGGPVPEGVPALDDNRPGGSFDLDRADPPAIDQGSILIQR